MSLKARAIRLGETYLAAEFLIQLAPILHIMLKLESAFVPRWRDVASTGIYDTCR